MQKIIRLIVLVVVGMVLSISLLNASENKTDTDTKTKAPKKNNTEKQAKLRDLFTFQGKPVSILLMPNAKGNWILDLESAIDGAMAKVPMNNGIVIDMVITVEKAGKGNKVVHSLKTKLSDEKVTFTVCKLPTGRFALGMQSKQYYGERFRMIWEVLPVGVGGEYELYFVQEPNNPK